MTGKSNKDDAQSESLIEKTYILWLLISLVCAIIDLGFFGWRIYVTINPLPGGLEGLETALLAMLIYGIAIIIGTISGLLAGKGGGFKNRSIPTYIGIAAGPLSILLHLIASPWLL